MSDILQNKIHGCLIGGAIGDALGYQIEFERGIREKQVTRFKDDVGIISDDTQMTLFTANALIWYQTDITRCGTSISTSNAIYHAYLDWLDTQMRRRDHNAISWIKEIPELNKKRDPGNTCLSALCSGKMGTIANTIHNSNGCGSVMRIAPCGVFANDQREAGKLAAECAAITHGNKSGLIASYVCASMINALIHNDVSIEQALDTSMKLIEDDHRIYTEKRRAYQPNSISTFKDMIDKAMELSKQDVPCADAIRQIGEGWCADEAFAIVLYSCLKYPNSFEDAIVCAVNHDGDSDSTGAIAGNIMGATCGVSSIPQYYVDNVELKDVVLEIADDLYAATTNSNVVHNEAWIKKYVNCLIG